VRIETRLIEKTAAAASVDSWTFTAYAWSQDQHSTTVADASGVSNALGTTHDIPSQVQCKSCHTQTGFDGVNGFGAIQLNHSQTELSLDCLIDEGLLVNGTSTTLNVSSDNARIPGDAGAQAALGYLHANCGHCHGGSAPRAGLAMASLVGVLNVSDEPVSKTAICQCLTRWTGRANPMQEPYVRRILAGHALNSGVIGRMSVRGAGEQMPPLGSEVVDDNGIAAVSAWIDSLDASACDAAPACPPPAAAPMAGAGGAVPATNPTAGAPAPASSSLAGSPAPAPLL
jgi:hypothetical protein